jgi:hypothetical protein
MKQTIVVIAILAVGLFFAVSGCGTKPAAKAENASAAGA